jgi:hypothetical protein
MTTLCASGSRMQNSADDCLQSALEDGDLGVVLLALRRIA